MPAKDMGQTAVTEQDVTVAPIETKAETASVETIEKSPVAEAVVESAATEAPSAVVDTEAEAERELKPRRSRKPRQLRPETDEPIEASFEAIRAGAVTDELPPVPDALLEMHEEILRVEQEEKSDAPESDETTVIESESRRRRPRRRRRPTKNLETVSLTATDSDAAETTVVTATGAAVEHVHAVPSAEQASTLAPVDQPSEEKVAEIPVEQAPEFVSEAPTSETTVNNAAAVETVHEVKVEVEAIADIAKNLAENLAKAGLEQVETDASLVTPLSYEAKPVAGRPRPVLEVIEEGPLTQIETDPKFMA